MPTQVGIHVFPAVISKDVDGGPPPAMTITTNRRANDFGGWYDLRDFQDDVGIFSGVGIELPTPGLARVGGGSGTLAAATALPWTLVSLWPSPRAGPRNYPRPAAAARPKAVQHRLTGDLPIATRPDAGSAGATHPRRRSYLRRPGNA
jgi:hypothetical protein